MAAVVLMLQTLRQQRARSRHQQLATYPRTPKMNAHIERFNRTIQEEFVNFHTDLPLTDSVAFNDKLFDYLTWYNLDRPHHALRLQSPMQVIGNYLNSNQCNMQWPNTRS